MNRSGSPGCQWPISVPRLSGTVASGRRSWKIRTKRSAEFACSDIVRQRDYERNMINLDHLTLGEKTVFEEGDGELRAGLVDFEDSGR